MRCSSEVGPAPFFGLVIGLHREEGMESERFHPPTQETPQFPVRYKEGNLGLPS